MGRRIEAGRRSGAICLPDLCGGLVSAGGRRALVSGKGAHQRRQRLISRLSSPFVLLLVRAAFLQLHPDPVDAHDLVLFIRGPFLSGPVPPLFPGRDLLPGPFGDNLHSILLFDGIDRGGTGLRERVL